MSGESEEKDTGANGEVKSEGATTKGEGAEAGAPASSKPAVDPLAEAKAEAAKYKDQWMRTAADFDNFRKRSRRELEDSRKAGKEDLLKEFLPVFDNLERAVASATRATDIKGVAEGLSMVLRQYTDTLARGGISKVPSVGSEFDPTHHEAIQQVETDEHPPGTIVAEVQPGYMQGDRLIRAAMVVVAKPKAKSSEDAGNAGGSGEGQ